MKEDQKKRFRKLFNINPSSIDYKGELLYKVIDLDPNICDEDSELTYEDFIEFLYVHNVPSVEKNIVRLKENLLNGNKFHYIHSYGKNGKSTFIRRFKKENELDFNCIIIDYKDFQINRTENKHSLITKTVDFFYVLGDLYGDLLIETMINLFTHISTTQLKTKIDATNNEARLNYNNLFSSFRLEFIDHIEKVKNKLGSLNPETLDKEKILFFQDFNILIEDLISRRKLNPIEFFNFLILITLKLYGTNTKKTVIIFDNIDDILTHASEYLTSQIFPQVHTFLMLIKKYINEKKEFIDETVLDDVKFIFSYRTANYVSSMFHVNYNPSSNFQKRSLLNAPIYILSSVKSSAIILKKKLDFYDLLCSTFNIDKAPSFDFLNKILDSFNSEDAEYQYLFKLWNGNQFAFIECFKSISLAPIDYEIINNPQIAYNIKRGAFLFHIVKYYTRDRYLHVIPESTLSSAFQYAFTIESCGEESCKCNLLRLFLSFIINHNEKANVNKKFNDDAGDVLDKGVSFRTILERLTQFKINKEIVYNKETFQELFSRMFYDDIDAFDYFIICVKNTDFRSGTDKYFGKKYDFNEDIELFFNYYNSDPSKLSALDSIRIYYNTNSKYFLNAVKKHFEFFSCCLIKNSHPLSYNLKIFRSTPESDLFEDKKFEFTYNFNNNLFINNVYEQVDITLNAITDFYISAIIDIYPPKEYCSNSNLALNSIFHYDDLISKHITYIEKIRQQILSGVIIFEFQQELSHNYLKSNDCDASIEILANINGRFIYWIERYIHLFSSNYDKIRNASRKIGKEMDTHSKATRTSFSILLNKIQEIKMCDFKDFNTKIETKDEKNKRGA